MNMDSKTAAIILRRALAILESGKIDIAKKEMENLLRLLEGK